ncbi:thiamine monophosphate synthase [Terriglobus roseus DSM 18391]|uniref:Thiamine monophosphate synthase n=1 Tax=Terriglobus roseus (strain DSM 18391 / NRRL B-41598 / KBS 63) TaxID=926566 RepID=I3ZBP0_TERRK|nr:thiamine phosphate synthase [Terriglobus roseus]AFL86658.1 thiamine monophosphate synthase [Terriglobus roseus DSM 18391]
MLRYAITDRQMFPGDEQARREALIAQAARLSRDGVEYLQLREKDLSESETVALVKAVRAALLEGGGAPKLLLNGTAALAQWAGADGVHLSSTTFSQNLQTMRGLIVSASCHTIADVRRAAEFADVILFGPVFEKRVAGELVSEGVGLDRLREACAEAEGLPVFALGGVDHSNAQACVDAGAAGVAGIRMFA